MSDFDHFEEVDLRKRLEYDNSEMRAIITRLEAENKLLKAELKNIHFANVTLRAALSSIVHLQSRCTRAEIRDFAANVLRYDGGKITELGGDQTPAVKLLSAANTRIAALEAEIERLRAKFSEHF